jgi:hypothetical protein
MGDGRNDGTRNDGTRNDGTRNDGTTESRTTERRPSRVILRADRRERIAFIIAIYVVPWSPQYLPWRESDPFALLACARGGAG